MFGLELKIWWAENEYEFIIGTTNKKFTIH